MLIVTFLCTWLRSILVYLFWCVRLHLLHPFLSTNFLCSHFSFFAIFNLLCTFFTIFWVTSFILSFPSLKPLPRHEVLYVLSKLHTFCLVILWSMQNLHSFFCNPCKIYIFSHNDGFVSHLSSTTVHQGEHVLISFHAPSFCFVETFSRRNVFGHLAFSFCPHSSQCTQQHQPPYNNSLPPYKTSS